MAKKQQRPAPIPIDLEPVTKRLVSTPEGDVLVPDDGPVLGQGSVFGRSSNKKKSLVRGATGVATEGVLTQVYLNALNEWSEDIGISKERYVSMAMREFLREKKADEAKRRFRQFRKIMPKGGRASQADFDTAMDAETSAAATREVRLERGRKAREMAAPDGLAGLPKKAIGGKNPRVKYLGKNVQPASAEDDLRDHLARGRTVSKDGNEPVKWDKRIELSVNPNEPLPDQKPSTPPQAAAPPEKKPERQYVPSPKVRELEGRYHDAKEDEEKAYSKWHGYYTSSNTRPRRGLIGKIVHAPADIYTDIQKSRWDRKSEDRKRKLRKAGTEYADARTLDRRSQGFEEAKLMRKVRNILGEQKRFHFLKDRNEQTD